MQHAWTLDPPTYRIEYFIETVDRPSTYRRHITHHTSQGPGRIPSSHSGEILDLSKDTFHHPAVRAPWCELSPPLAGFGSFEILRDGGLRNGGSGAAYERIQEGGGGDNKGGGATAINIGPGRK